VTLTKRQRQLLNYLEKFLREKGYSPSLQELARGLRLSSVATVHKHLKGLEEKGFIEREPGQYRSLAVVPRKRPRKPAATLPLAGRIAAGRPIEAVEQRATIGLEDITRGRDAFVLEVSGDSMIGEHIMPGDWVVVERTAQPLEGEIVVALIDDQEATLKRFHQDPNGMVWLQAANPHYAPMRLQPDRVRIQGRLLGILRKY
jgi:repressor LexA